MRFHCIVCIDFQRYLCEIVFIGSMLGINVLNFFLNVGLNL